MRINFTFRNVDTSERLKQYASDKVGKLQKYLRAPLDAEITVSKERHLHRVDINLHADGQRFVGHIEDPDLYASVDLVLDKIDRQVRSTKSALTSKKQRVNKLE